MKPKMTKKWYFAKNVKFKFELHLLIALQNTSPSLVRHIQLSLNVSKLKYAKLQAHSAINFICKKPFSANTEHNSTNLEVL